MYCPQTLAIFYKLQRCRCVLHIKAWVRYRQSYSDVYKSTGSSAGMVEIVWHAPLLILQHCLLLLLRAHFLLDKVMLAFHFTAILKTT